MKGLKLLMINLQVILKTLKDYDEEIKIMEVCGTHTANIFNNGIRSLISPKIKLISGPGCPVCVTAGAYIDRLCELSLLENHTVITFGDMLRVKGTEYSLNQAKAMGGSVQLVYSPLEAISFAEKNPNITYVVGAIGFETTAPTYSVLINRCIQKNIKNIKLLTALKTIIPALSWVCENQKVIDGFICPGNVSVVIGASVYEELASKYNKPLAIAGFEGEHILAAIYDIVIQRQKGINKVHNLYKNAVKAEGNKEAIASIESIFRLGNAYWRGLGEIPQSGLYLKDEYLNFDAGSFSLNFDIESNPNCMCANVIIGEKNPNECKLFGLVCNPNNPQGACMVSSEGACGIWYKNCYKTILH